MKRRIISILAVLVLAFSLCAVPAWADGGSFILGLGDDPSVDDANLRAQELYDEYGIAVCYAASDTLNGMTLPELARTVYEQYFAYNDGILLYDCTEATDYYVYRAGRAQELINDESCTALCTTYYAGGSTYIESVNAYLSAATEVLAYVTAEDVPQGMTTLPDGSYIPAERRLDYVVDNAGVLTAEELASLNAAAAAVSEQYKCDVAYILVPDTDGRDTENFTFDFYEANGYGYGSNDDGVMLLIDVVNRQFRCITHGYGAYAVTDAGQEYLEEHYLRHLKNSDWAKAGEAYISAVETLLSGARDGGAPYDVDNMPRESNVLMWVFIDLVIGIVLALIPVSVMKRQLKTVQTQRGAANYVRDNSFNLVRSHDHFVTSFITKTKRPEPNDNNSGGGGGGTSFSSSSSGRSYGSHGGSF